MSIKDDPVVQSVEDEYNRIARLAEAKRKQVAVYEDEMYSDSVGFLIDRLGDLSIDDTWWLVELWDELQKRDMANDEIIGRLIRLYIKKSIHYMALIQADEDGLTEDNEVLT